MLQDADYGCHCSLAMQAPLADFFITYPIYPSDPLNPVIHNSSPLSPHSLAAPVGHCEQVSKLPVPSLSEHSANGTCASSHNQAQQASGVAGHPVALYPVLQACLFATASVTVGVIEGVETRVAVAIVVVGGAQAEQEARKVWLLGEQTRKGTWASAQMKAQQGS